MGNNTTNLQRVRIAVGLSQSQLATKANLPLSTIQKYERGACNIDGASLSTLCTLAETLNVKISEILESEELKIRLEKDA